MRRLSRVLVALSGLALAACAAPAPPDAPPAYTAPPPVATDGAIPVGASAFVPMAPERLRAFLAERPMTSFLAPSGSLAPPVGAGVLSGDWAEPGAARWVELADGHYIAERVVANEPERFRYQIYVFTNAAGRGVDQIVAEQRFVAVEGGTRFEWDYDVYPRSALTRPFVSRFVERELRPYIEAGTAAMARAAREATEG